MRKDVLVSVILGGLCLVIGFSWGALLTKPDREKTKTSLAALEAKVEETRTTAKKEIEAAQKKTKRATDELAQAKAEITRLSGKPEPNINEPEQAKKNEQKRPETLLENQTKTTEPKKSESPTSAKRISPSDFEIVSCRGVWEDERLIVKGEIRNNGRVAGGPKIEVIARDAKGELLDSEQFWPNSINNIPPGGTCGIEYTISKDERAKTVEAKVIGVDVW
jgi:hypothetical protein